MIEERLARANRNYAVDFIRNGIAELVNVMGVKKGVDGGPAQAAEFLAAMFAGMGEKCEIQYTQDGPVTQSACPAAQPLDQAHWKL